MVFSWLIHGCSCSCECLHIPKSVNPLPASVICWYLSNTAWNIVGLQIVIVVFPDHNHLFLDVTTLVFVLRGYRKRFP